MSVTYFNVLTKAKNMNCTSRDVDKIHIFIIDWLEGINQGLKTSGGVVSWHHRNVNMLIWCYIKISGVRLTRKSCIVGLVYEIRPQTNHTDFFVGCSHVLVVKTWMECNRMELQGSWDTFLTPCLKNSYCTKAFKNFTKSKATAKYICLHMYIKCTF